MSDWAKVLAKQGVLYLKKLIDAKAYACIL
jgi:hypothetical protein